MNKKLISAFLLLSLILAQKSYAQVYNQSVTQEATQPEEYYYLPAAISIPVDLPYYNLKVSTDDLSQSFYFFAEALQEEQDNNMEQAISAIKKTIDKAPDNSYVYSYAIALSLDASKYEEAEKWGNYLIAKDSSSAENWVLYGNAKWAVEDRETAKRAYLTAQKLDSTNTEALFQYASLIGSDNPDTAIKCLLKYKALRPEDASEIDYRIAVLYNLKGDLPNTEKFLLQSVKENPYNVNAHYSLIELYEIKKDTTSELAAMETLAALEPNNVKLLKEIAETWLNTDINKADEYFRKIKKIDKNDPSACFWLATLAEDKGDYKEAAKQLEESAALWKQPELLSRLSFYYTKTDRYKEGVDLMEKAHEKFPDNDDITAYLALGYEDTQRKEKALELLDYLVRKNPNNTIYRLNYAMLCDELKRFYDTERHLRIVLEQEPDNAKILNYLGYSLADRGIKLEEAKALISRALAIQPDDGAYLDSMAWVEFKLGNISAAEEWIKKAAKKISYDPIIWQHFGDINMASGKTDIAWLAWKTAITLEDKNEQKLYRDKIKQAQKKLPKISAAILTKAYYKTFLPSGYSLSSFGKLEAKAKGKKIKADIVLNYSSAGKMTMHILGPMLTPIWTGFVSGTDTIMLDVPEHLSNHALLQKFAAAMLFNIRDWYAGAYLQPNINNWRTKKYITDNGDKVYIGKNGLPQNIKTFRANSVKLNLDDYFLHNFYLFPAVFEFNLPFSKVKITIDKDRFDFKPINKLDIGDINDKN